MTFGSLFSGIGGMDLGLCRAGMTPVWHSEIDPYACRVLAKHWPGVPNLGDIARIDWAGVERPDLVCGGFPCQDISFAGKGAGLAGKRSGLWYEFARCVRDLRPRFVLVENVAALLVRGLDAVLGTLASLGYDAEWGCIPAAAVGAPHVRDRVFIVADRHEDRRVVDARQSNRGGMDTTKQSSCFKGCPQAIPPDDGGPPGFPRTLARKPVGDHPPGQGWVVDPGTWAPEPGVGRMADGVPSGLDRIAVLGNAVVPRIAEFIGRRLMEATA